MDKLIRTIFIEREGRVNTDQKLKKLIEAVTVAQTSATVTSLSKSNVKRAKSIAREIGITKFSVTLHNDKPITNGYACIKVTFTAPTDILSRLSMDFWRPVMKELGIRTFGWLKNSTLEMKLD